jgi:hypothetical protein
MSGAPGASTESLRREVVRELERAGAHELAAAAGGCTEEAIRAVYRRASELAASLDESSSQSLASFLLFRDAAAEILATGATEVDAAAPDPLPEEAAEDDGRLHLEVVGEAQLADDYRTLLRDGIVLWPRGGGVEDAWPRLHTRWAAALETRAQADGLRCRVAYLRRDRGEVWPAVTLTRARPGGSGGPWPPEQAIEAARTRPLVEREWGAALARARRRAA